MTEQLLTVALFWILITTQKDGQLQLKVQIMLYFKARMFISIRGEEKK